ncbi:MAG TPA: hypothetical protein PKD48_12915 [Sphingopyxis sp.]|nr:hypothetical protein [Sphingopyxis sp.]HMQ20570.1 hypothetical protein [Sphingopyxis sp.]
MGCETTIVKQGNLPDLKALRQQGQLLRGEFLDAFARLEGEVLAYAARIDLKLAAGMPFSQKLARLAKERDRFRHPGKLDDRIEAIRCLLAIRADVVHAPLAVAVEYDGQDIRCWLHFRNAAQPGVAPRILSADELTALARRTSTLAAQFSQQQLKAATPAASASASAA